MHKKSRSILIFFIILIFGASSIYSNNVIENMKSKKIGYLNDVIFIPVILGIHKDYEFLMKVNQNELKLFNKDLILVYTKNFEKNINSVQLLEKNKTNIFLVAVNNKIYYLDKCLNIKEEFSPDFEIKKVLSIWNKEEKTYNFIVQSDRSIYCYSSAMTKLWRYPINEDFDEEILSLSLTNNQFNLPIIFGNTKNEVFLVGSNGGEIVKKNFSEVFSVHPLSESIVVYCHEHDAPDEKKYVLKMIRFDDPKKENLNILYASNKPFNAVTSGSIQSDKPYMIFFQEGAEFMAINQNGTKYLENLIVLNFQVKKIIIEDLDNMSFHYKFPDSRQHQENVSELALLCENEIIFCVPKLFVENSAIKMRFIEIDKHQIDGLDGFFIPKRQTRFPKRAFYGVSDEVHMIRLMYESYYFGHILDKVNEYIEKENYNLANRYLQDLKKREQWIDYYGYGDYVDDLESEIVEKINVHGERADQTFSRATQQFKEGNYMGALDSYYSSCRDYEKSGPDEKIGEVYKEFLYCVEKIYEIGEISNFETKIKIYSYIFDSDSYSLNKVISEIKSDESLNEEFREKIDKFEQNHFGAFKSSLQEIMDSADADEEEGKLELALDKYYAVRAPYDKYKLDKEKLAFIDNKIITLNSKIEKKESEKNLWYFIGLIIVFLAVYTILDKKIVPWWRKKREKPEEKHYENLKKRIEEAEDLLKNGYVIAAGCLTGVILETILDIYIKKSFNPIEIQNFIKNYKSNKFTLGKYIQFLQKNRDISKQKIDRLNWCRDFRNDVAHSLDERGKDVASDDVERLVDETTFFLDFFLKEKAVSKKKV